MKNKKSHIHSLDSLEKEIYRLKLKAGDTEKKLGANMGTFRKNAFNMAFNSVFFRKQTPDREKKNGEDRFFKNEKLNSIFSKMANRFSDRASESIDSLFDRLFRKRKRRH